LGGVSRVQVSKLYSHTQIKKALNLNFNHTGLYIFAGSKFCSFSGIRHFDGSNFYRFSGIRLYAGSNFCHLSGMMPYAGSMNLD